MTKILYNSSVGVLTSTLMAATLMGNINDASFILPDIPYEYKVETPMIYMPHITESFYQVESKYELEKIILDVLAILTKKPSQLDLEMLSVMDDDIWDLF